MALSYIGLGSNLNQPEQQIKEAIMAIRLIPSSMVVAVSSLYFSRPMGPQDQPDYMNAVLALDTQLSPHQLLDALQAVENNAGRVRKDERWGARVLDLDILMYDQLTIADPRLTVPHYGMHEREFVLLPLAEIAPDLHLPNGISIAQLAKEIDTNGLKIHSKLC